MVRRRRPRMRHRLGSAALQRRGHPRRRSPHRLRWSRPRRPPQRCRSCPPAGSPRSPPPTRPTTTGSARSSIRRADCRRATLPPDLVAVSRAGLSGGGSIRRIAIADLKALANAARKAGVRLAVESAYRSEARQQQDVRGLGPHLRRSRGQTLQCARRTLGAPARDRHRFQGRGRRVPLDAAIRALAACAMAGGERLAIRLDPELSAGCGDTDLLRR